MAERAFGKGTPEVGKRRRQSLFMMLEQSLDEAHRVLMEEEEPSPWVSTFLSTYLRVARGGFEIRDAAERQIVDSSEALLAVDGPEIARLASSAVSDLPRLPLATTPGPMARVMLAHALTAAEDMALIGGMAPPSERDRLLGQVDEFAAYLLPSAQLPGPVLEDTRRALEHRTVAPTDPAWGLWTAVERLAKKAK